MTANSQQFIRLMTITTMSVAIVATSGCSTFRRNVGDSSLDYQKATKLEPVQLPANAQTLPFTPIYNVPQTNENTLKLKNEKGKRFELPRPISSVK